MKQTLLKYLMSIVLTFAIFFVSIANVNATDIKTSEISKIDVVTQQLIRNNSNLKSLKNHLYSNLKILENIGLETDFIDKAEIIDNHIFFVYKYLDGVKNKISVDTIDTGIMLNIQEGTIHNKFLINNDGTMYIDEKKVVLNNNLLTEDFSPSEEISLYSGEVTNWVTSTCPYGSKSSYTYRLGTKKDSDITLTTAISNLATTAVILIISAELGVSVALSTGLSIVVTWVKDRNPTTRGLSYKATNYAHKNYKNTYIKPIKKYAYRSDFTWYPNKNYKGTTYKETLYYIKQIG